MGRMTDKRRGLALLELGWSYRRIERETGVRRETVARYDPRRQSNAANLSTGSESMSDELADGEANAANLSAGSSLERLAFGPRGIGPYTASAETRRGARAKWCGVLNGLPHPIQVVIRARPAAARRRAHQGARVSAA